MLETLSEHRYIIGAKQVKNAVVSGKVSKLYIASDSDPDIISSIVELANERDITVSYISTRSELGKMCGIDVKSACAAETL
ncbi:MAG: ribosomal L7Ae/L30e/S12e/Gadd45 family protein [Clostridia bacterium]|nr:ribosomal L7Ae/L30e/S12e/Gadd45 family protein [Clostridia bacterium]